jgi:cell division protein FtsB
MPRKRRQLYKLRYKQVPGIVVVTAMIIVVAVFSVINNNLNRGIEQLRGMVEEGSYLVSMKQKEVSDLASKLELAATDDFIANEARTQYGYIFPGEIRFVVTNPEVLGLSPASPAP